MAKKSLQIPWESDKNLDVVLLNYVIEMGVHLQEGKPGVNKRWSELYDFFKDSKKKKKEEGHEADIRRLEKQLLGESEKKGDEKKRPAPSSDMFAFTAKLATVILYIYWA